MPWLIRGRIGRDSVTPEGPPMFTLLSLKMIANADHPAFKSNTKLIVYPNKSNALTKNIALQHLTKILTILYQIFPI
jgi:hypothetical protein